MKLAWGYKTRKLHRRDDFQVSEEASLLAGENGMLLGAVSHPPSRNQTAI